MLAASPAAIEAVAPAKINLALHVTGRRADGYHLIETLVVFTRFGDRLTFEESDQDSFEVTGPFAHQFIDAEAADNLVVLARDAVRAWVRAETGPVRIRLEKNLPVASGMGGGSSDAATTLRALSSLWSLNLTESELARIGSRLGADVPMCLASKPLVARGIGDDITALPNLGELALVLVNPGAAVATAEVFGALAERNGAPLPEPPSPMSPAGPVDFHGLCDWLATTRNDLEAPARTLAPAIDDALAALRQQKSAFAGMSGSGATCFGLFETGNIAKRAAAAIRRAEPGWFVASTRSGGSYAG